MRIVVVGAGYVGLVTGACLASQGHRVTCIDRLPARVRAISRGEPPFHEPGLSELIWKGIAAGSLSASTELAGAMEGAGATLIAVDTPDVGGKIDLSQVEQAARDIGRALRNGSDYHLVAVRSTVIPGTTDTVVRKAIEEESGRTAGEGFGLCVNPEFLREGRAVADFTEPDRIVIGQWDDRSGRMMCEIYANFTCPRIVTTLRNAEFIKYASNSLLATLISFSNEIASLCEATPDADVDIVMDGVHLDRRLSPSVDGVRVSPAILDYLRAGSGFGGSCLPKDVNALRRFARSKGLTTPLLDSVLSVNRARPARLVGMAERLLDGLEGRTVVVLGLAFKPGTDDLRDSPALRVIHSLRKRGALVRACDPLAGDAARERLPTEVELAEANIGILSGADAAIIVTACPEFRDWDWHEACSMMKRPILIDGRNALRGVALPSAMIYQAVGRVLASNEK